jgi:hypothetical protein
MLNVFYVLAQGNCVYFTYLSVDQTVKISRLCVINLVLIPKTKFEGDDANKHLQCLAI